MASPKRLERVASLLKEEVSRILARELALGKETLVTVTAVDLSADLTHATGRVSIFPKEREREISARLEKNVWGIQQILNERLRMRPVPKIRFVLDRSEAEAEKIEKALGGLEK